MTEQLSGHNDAQQFSEPERLFIRRWQELVERAGGRKVVARRIAGWTRATVYRDYAGEPLPTAGRLRQLCEFLRLPDHERDELLKMLEQARSARQARRQGPGGSPSVSGITAEASASSMGSGIGSRDPLAQGERPVSARPQSRRWDRVPARFVIATVTAVVVAAGFLWWQPWQGVARPSDGPVATGSYLGLGLKAVSVPVSSLSPALAEALRRAGARGSSVEGYAFRNMKNPSLCLTTADTGPNAGQNHGRVDVEPCDYAPNQVWIPLQWEANRSRWTQLYSLRYQAKCLNAQKTGGRLANGHTTQLWDCYQSPNEYWDFGDWYQHAKDRLAYPIFVESAQFCLDADKYAFGNGGAEAPVNIWTQYKAPQQFWS